MKTVYIVRHGKAAPAGSTPNDFDRMLTDTGVSRTIKIALYMAESKPKIDCIIASPAERAYDTALILADKMGIPATKLIKEEKLFTGDESDALELIETLDDSVQSVMIVGHNPWATHLANRFVAPALEKLPTSGVASVHFETNTWADITKAPVKQNFTVWPGML
jgi:phosphohistidine phosphatase